MITRAALLTALSLATGTTAAQDLSLRMNQIQTIGTHNSYRIAPPQPILDFIAVASPTASAALDYSHVPIQRQLDEFKIRQLEFDLYADPDGGLFANPIGHVTLTAEQQRLIRHPNADGAMNQPGLKVLHSPGYDYRSTVPTFADALRLVRDWSKANPTHVPILILVELKDSVVGPVLVTPIAFDAEQLDAVDREIRSVFDPTEFISPDRIRGEHAQLRDAILVNGWPRLGDSLGQVWFAMDNEGELRDRYLANYPSLKGRAMFVSVPPDHPAAAFRKLNDPERQWTEIRESVRRGLIVRTRAESATSSAGRGDTTCRDLAFQSGAQYISTDYPIPDPRRTNYQVQLPARAEYQINPVSHSQAEASERD